jgi:hypothetical protein
MLSLAETQARLRAAVVEGERAEVAPLLAGGRDPAKRLAIHQRNYETSLVNVLLGKFPAVVWLLGMPFVRNAAKDFVRRHPPRAPCVAEYGEDFPAFVAGRADAAPYVERVGRLEWHLGHVALAIEHQAVAIESLATIDPANLPDVVLALQPGLRYLAAPWPIDDLMKLYLTEEIPDTYEFARADVWLQIRGARGTFRFDRLTEAAFVFRSALAQGSPLGAASEQALDAEASFDPGLALAALVAEGLVTGVVATGAGPAS